MTRRAKHAIWAAVVGVVVFCALPGYSDSLARIVRLSDVEGGVQVDRGTGQGFEQALLNLPIAQGMVLRTGEDGRAEVEFEDGTVARLAPNSQVNFQQLSLRASGAKSTVIKLDQGTAFFNVHHKRSDEFTLVLAQRQIPIAHSAHFRVTLLNDEVKLAVYSGKVVVNGEGGSTKVTEGRELTLDLAGEGNVLAKNIQPEQYDEWDKQRTDYHERYYTSSDYSDYPYYGRGDLGFYGTWYDVPGCGGLWQPYNAGFGWNPFLNGYWGWYPTWGYTWISAYPWGWLPYRYGSWVWVPGWGWGWRPGNSWGPWTRVPRVVNPPVGFMVPTAPVQPNRPILPVRHGPDRYGFGSAVGPLSVAPLGPGVKMPRFTVFNKPSVTTPPVVGGRGGPVSPGSAFGTPGRGFSGVHSPGGHISGGIRR